MQWLISLKKVSAVSVRISHQYGWPPWSFFINDTCSATFESLSTHTHCSKLLSPYCVHGLQWIFAPLTPSAYTCLITVSCSSLVHVMKWSSRVDDINGTRQWLVKFKHHYIRDFVLVVAYAIILGFLKKNYLSCNCKYESNPSYFHIIWPCDTNLWEIFNIENKRDVKICIYLDWACNWKNCHFYQCCLNNYIYKNNLK